MRLIVVEGPDGAGKSTLIENLRYSTDRYFSLIKPTGPPRTIFNLSSVINWLNESSSLAGIPLVLDRHPFISEPIYGAVLRGENLVAKLWSGVDVQKILLSTVNRIIYCRPPFSTIIANCKGRQLEGVSANLTNIIHLYDNLMEEILKAGIPVIDYDWTSNRYSAADIERLFFGEQP